MQEEPVFSGGAVKVLLVLLVAAALGGGGYALAQGGIDLPDINLDTTSGETTELQNTNLENTTIGGDQPATTEPDAPAKPKPLPGNPGVPQAAREAQRLQDCIERAGQDSDAVFACFDEFQ